jgi:Na+-transporting NADH:ubiquinone oxidoreductase subunit A
MSQTFKIRKGHDIKLVGGAPKTDLGRITASTYAVTPLDFPGITPKLAVKAGTQVKAGDTLFFDKDRPEVKICSPVSGEVAEVKRGAKRKILAVLILADSETTYADHGAFGSLLLDLMVLLQACRKNRVQFSLMVFRVALFQETLLTNSRAKKNQ